MIFNKAIYIDIKIILYKKSLIRLITGTNFLKAIYIVLSRFCKDTVNSHVKLLIDNIVAVTYISKMGGQIANFNNLTGSIWKFSIERNIWLSADVENLEADFMSGNKDIDLDRMLDPDVYRQIEIRYGKCDIDLFASR